MTHVALPAGRGLSAPGAAHRRLVHATIVAAALVASLISSESPAATARRELVVCADSGNLPFSNEHLEGFENKVAELIADELDASLRYRWHVSWSGSTLRSLRTGECDLLMEVPSALQGVTATRPYFSSTYVFVTARDRHAAIDSFDDPALRTLRIGLHAIGRGGANTPVVNALARRGIHRNVTGYPMWGDGAGEAPQARVVAAVASGEIDTAIVWGPIAGYFAQRYREQLAVTMVTPEPGNGGRPFVFDMALGVREGDEAFKVELEGILERRSADIRHILDGFGVPLVEATRPSPAAQP